MPNLLWAFERGALWVREHESRRVDTSQIVPTINATLGEAQSADSDILARAMGLVDAVEVTHRFRNGRRCFVARVDGVIASYGWVSCGVERIGELERSFHMAPDEAYIWDCATLPKHRGQHLYCALLTHMAATLHRENIHRLWIGASLRNTPSIRGFSTSGFQQVLTMTHLRLLGMRYVWITGNPQAASSLVARARECLSV